MTEDSTPADASGPIFRRPLIALDGSKTAGRAASIAAALTLLDPPAEVIIAGALELADYDGLWNVGDARKAEFRETWRRRCLESTATALRERGVTVAAEAVRIGSPATALLELVEEHDADLVVLGRRGLGRLARFFLGSVSRRLVEQCPVPILVVPDGAEVTSEAPGVVVATDFHAEADRALELALRLTRRLKDPRLVLAHAVSPGALPQTDAFRSSESQIADYNRRYEDLVERSEQTLEALADRLSEQESMPVTGVFRLRDIATGVLEAADTAGAGLIVLGTHQRRGLTRWLRGSVAESIIRRADCPVLVVPGAAAARIDDMKRYSPKRPDDGRPSTPKGEA